jgi:hypothetical protein
MKLDCGHELSKHREYDIGYGIDSSGKKHCYDCCLEIDKVDMRKFGNVFAYHGEDDKGNTIVTNWPGGVISDKVNILSYSRDNFGGKRIYLRFLFEGEVWSGFSMGKGMYLRAKRTKLNGLYDW